MITHISKCVIYSRVGSWYFIFFHNKSIVDRLLKIIRPIGIERILLWNGDFKTDKTKLLNLWFFFHDCRINEFCYFYIMCIILQWNQYENNYRMLKLQGFDYSDLEYLDKLKLKIEITTNWATKWYIKPSSVREQLVKEYRHSTTTASHNRFNTFLFVFWYNVVIRLFVY